MLICGKKFEKHVISTSKHEAIVECFDGETSSKLAEILKIHLNRGGTADELSEAKLSCNPYPINPNSDDSSDD